MKACSNKIYILVCRVLVLESIWFSQKTAHIVKDRVIMDKYLVLFYVHFPNKSSF